MNQKAVLAHCPKDQTARGIQKAPVNVYTIQKGSKRQIETLQRRATFKGSVTKSREAGRRAVVLTTGKQAHWD